MSGQIRICPLGKIRDGHADTYIYIRVRCPDTLSGRKIIRGRRKSFFPLPRKQLGA